MSNILPWGDIDRPSDYRNYSRIRVDPDHNCDFYWAIDFQGRYALILKCSMFIDPNIFSSLPSLKSISYEVRTNGPENQFIIIFLHDKDMGEVFHQLCIDLINSCRNCTDDLVAVRLVRSRLKSWHILLNKKYRGILSRSEIQGLFGELSFIRELLLGSALGHHAIVTAWADSSNSHQDFIFSKTAVEIKTLCGGSQSTVKIASENQLYTHLDRIYLKVYYLAENHEQDNDGFSLNALAANVRDILSRHDPDLGFLLDERLIERNYLTLPDYNQPFYSVLNSESYIVGEEFPKISPRSIPLGICNVRYEINLASIKSFEVNIDFTE